MNLALLYITGRRTILSFFFTDHKQMKCYEYDHYNGGHLRKKIHQISHDINKSLNCLLKWKYSSVKNSL